MPTLRFILYMKDETIKIVYTKHETELLKGQYKNIVEQRITENGWKEVLL